jgi:hypothetical protein
VTKGKYFSGDRCDDDKATNVARHVLQLVQKFNEVLAKMSDEEMNIDEGILFAKVQIRNSYLMLSVASGGAVRRKGRGFQKSGKIAVLARKVS